ncbi:MAG: hypothetical protein L3K19_00740 [Thermoplasmata archaeon]|nr:hypothetical protein [Thermoplasmata archaeon]
MNAPGLPWTPPAPESPPELRRPSLTWDSGFLRSRSLASRWYLVPMLGMIAVVAAMAAVAYSRSPVPPGVDPGHWLSISYGYVGLPNAPDPTDQMLFYSPLLFPFLGGLVLLTGNPLVAADVFAIGLFVLYGLSVAHLARRFLVSGPLQVALVGLAVLSGPTIQMLFWGGYPNLLGFVLINEALIALLAFVRAGRTVDGALFYALLALTYLAHDLSFVVLMATVGMAGLYLLLLRRIHPRFLLRPVNLLGALGLALVVGGYSELTTRLGIGHADYVGANPSAYYIDQVGELFAPLAHAPLLAPAGPSVYLDPVATAVLLAVAPLVGLVALLGVQHAVPGRVDRRITIAAAWLAAALTVPGIGYLAHVDTDYTRFLYFLPLPFFLVTLAAVERAYVRELVPGPERSPPDPAVPGGSPARWVRPKLDRNRVNATAMAGFIVALALGMVFATVTVPVIEGNELASTATAHDVPFLQAMQWLKDNRTAGSVLTVPSTARWTEALTDRDAYTVGPVWLLFAPFQIVNAQEAYWALTSQEVLLNSQAGLSFSGFATPVMSQGPMYTAYAHGLPFPVVRLLPGSFEVNATGVNGTHTYGLSGGVLPSSGALGSRATNLTVTYTCPVATVRESSSMSTDGALVRFTVVPDPGVVVNRFGLSISGPPSNSPTLNRDSMVATTFNGSNATFVVSGRLGQYPTPAEVDTTLRFDPAPRWVPPTVPTSGATWSASFSDPNGSSAFGVGVAFSSVGASYPSDGLPSSFSTLGFLDAQSIRFLLWPTHLAGSVETPYYESTFGFQPAYANSEWVILAR